MASYSPPNAQQSSVDFFVIGGTLSRDAQSYVTRQADDDLFAGLTQGQFCYVLTSRQMGKSSLMVRTAARLREAGAGVVLLDLTAIGQNLTAEQWYNGLLTQTGQQLELDDEFEEFWDAHPKLGPLQRWMQAIRHVLLPRYAGPVVIFVDEIDAVRSLPFSTDEFFSAIREFYNRRTENEELRRLTFCLLGVAAPSDLIRDTRTTPFNVGRRIELHDFTEAEAAPLVEGLRKPAYSSAGLLGQILHWTNGHPYLTQRLCQAVAEEAKGQTADEVDRLCRELFLTHQAQERDDNLLFVRERLLRSEVDLAGLLTVYSDALAGKSVHDDLTNPLITTLRLSGITRAEQGFLKVRNPIYERVFGREWVKENMPDAELRRQRAAYRRGLLRSAAIAALIIAAVASLAFAAVWQRNRATSEARRADLNFQQANQNAEEARKNLTEAERQRQAALDQQQLAEEQRTLAQLQRGVAVSQRDRAEQHEQSNRQLLYSAHMNLAARDWRDSSIVRMRDLLTQHMPGSGQNDLRGIEWYLLWALAYPDRQTLYFSGAFSCFVFSPDFRMFATGEMTDAKLWDMATGKQLSAFKEKGMQGAIEFSPDGKLLASDSADNSIRLWDIAAGRELRRLKGHTKSLLSLFFSRDGKILASTSQDQTAKLWDLATGNLLVTLKGHTDSVNSTAFSPDGRKMATGSDDETVKLWDLATGRELMTLKEHPAKGLSNPPQIYRVTFSPDGKRIMATGNFIQVAAWDAATGQALPGLGGHNSQPSALAFSHDGKLMATGSGDRNILLWDVGTWSVVKSFTGHGNQIAELLFSRDDKTLASASTDKTIKLWDVTADPNPLRRMGVAYVAYAPDGKKLASAQGKEVKIWDTNSWTVTATLAGNMAATTSLKFSPDGRMLATGSEDKTARLWDVAAGKERFTLKGHTDKVRDVAFSPDGKLLATASDDKTVRLWDVITSRELAILAGHEAVVQGVAFSPDGRLLASTSSDTSVRLWDVAVRRELTALKGHTSETYRVAFSPNGKLLATTSSDSTIKLWDVAARKELSTLKGHGGVVLPIAFSPDGKRLASSGEDSTIRFWDVATGQELAALRRNDLARAWSLTFSPDGKTLVSGSGWTGLLSVWRAATEQDVQARQR